MACASGWNEPLDAITRVRLRIGRGGAFPSAAKARVLCAHIGGEPDQLEGAARPGRVGRRRRAARGRAAS